MPKQTPELPAPIDAATVVIARDSADGIEVLMLRKNSKIHFGGMWVFPGGKVDPDDYNDQDVDPMGAFRRAAAREAFEEANVRVEANALLHFSHWLPPAIRPVRFSTHFFLTQALAEHAQVEVDGGEITDHTWMSASRALKRRHAGEIEVVTPTFVTLDWIRRHANIAELQASVGRAVDYHTRIIATLGGNIAFYAGDAAYESLDPAATGPRRRANMLASGWWWEEHDGSGVGPAPAALDF